MNDHKKNAVLISALILIISITIFSFIREDRADNTTIISIDEHPIASPSEATASAKVSSLTTTAVTLTTTSIATTAPSAEPLCININTAAREELMQLHGIGEAIADEIIAYRTSCGGFSNIEELMNVSGIGSSVFEDIRDFVYVEVPVYTTEPPPTEAVVTATEPESEAEPEVPHVLTLEEAVPINLNTAGVEELMLLPHVTEDIADEIIELRSGLGGFRNSYELLFAESLSQEQVAEIINYVTIE